MEQEAQHLRCASGLCSHTSTVLQKYELHEFMELSKSIRIGDLRMFNDAIVHHQGRFIRYVDISSAES